MKKCQQCGFDNEDDAVFCEKCSTAIPQEKECPNCHSKSKPTAKFCSECGHRFGGNASAAPNESVSIGDKNVIAGDVNMIGKKITVERGATYIHNEDETKRMVKCHICGRNILLSNSIECPRCHGITCENCYDRSLRLCLNCKEAEYSTALQGAMINGTITLEKRAELDSLSKTLNLSPEKAKEIEQSHQKTVADNKAAAGDDPKQRFILQTLGKAESLLFDRSNPAAAYNLLKQLHDKDPYREDILVDYILVSLETAPEEARGLLQKTNADILGVELIRIDQALAGKDVFAAVDLLTRADAKWPGNVLLDCRKVLVRKAMYDKTGERSWLDEANAILSSMREPETKLERSWVEKAQRAMGYDLPEATPVYCREQDLFYFVLNSGSDALYRLALCHEQDTEEYSRLIQLAAKSPSPSAEVLKRAVKCMGAGNGAKQNAEENARLYRQIADRGDAETQYQIAICFCKGDGVDEDEPEAVKYFRKAAKQGHAEAQFELAERYVKGAGVDKDDAEAADWYRKAAEQGHAKAQYCLGKLSSNHRDIWLRKAAKQGHARAQYDLGCYYEAGADTYENDAEAVKWYRKAAEQEDDPELAADARGKMAAALERMTRRGNAMVTRNDYFSAVKCYRKAAEQGYATAQNSLGECFRDGEGVDKDYVKATEWFRKAAEQNNARAQSNLGICYRDGIGLDKDDQEAAKWFRKAAEQGNSEAQFCLGCCYEKGTGVDKDEKEAVKWFRKVAEKWEDIFLPKGVICSLDEFKEKDDEEAVKQCCGAALNKLGKCYRDGIGLDKDDQKAAEWFRKAAEQGNSEAQFCLGCCYEKGTGVEKDNAAAKEWYYRAAKQGHSEAQFCLGLCYKNGEGVEKNDAEAAKWFRKAAEQGHSEAQFCLGCCYEKGTGVEKDNAEAVKWYRKAAENGHAEAQYSLGVCYANGFGVDIDCTEAEKWYCKAAEQGNENALEKKSSIKNLSRLFDAAGQGDRDAMLKLGKCYEEGKCVEMDAKEAVKWYKRAADQGNAEAQYSLGVCYANGLGVDKKDSTEAKKWYCKAAEQGFEQAKRKLDDLKREDRNSVLSFFICLVLAGVILWFAILGGINLRHVLGFWFWVVMVIIGVFVIILWIFWSDFDAEGLCGCLFILLILLALCGIFM